jgi:hypothetical protein
MQNVTFGLLVLVVIAAVSLACWKGVPESSRSDSSPTPARSESKSVDSSNKNSNNEMTEKKAEGFAGNLPTGFTMPTDDVGKKLLREYGAMFVSKGVTVPTKIVFKDESEVSSFQSGLSRSTETIGGFSMELQTAAMEDLRKAIADAKGSGVSISPRDTDSARRTYNETVGLWASRVDPALKHWVSNGKMTQAEADKIKAMSPYEQVSEVLKLEDKGIYFAKDLSKSIIYSVAPPGTSQHLSMIALDVKENESAPVRAILAKHKWYQTVVSDLPHFTYLGAEESELPKLGLKKITDGGRTFWVPDI